MDLTPTEIEEIESLITQLETLDPAELPGPASQLVDILNRIFAADDES